MNRPQHNTTTSSASSTCHDRRQYYCLHNPDGYLNSVLYQVVPAGKNFFHVLEVTSGRVRGFRSDHIKACELAKQLEAKLHAFHGGIVSSAG
jgi:hypothetical protein